MFIFLKNKSFFKELIWHFLLGIYILYSFFQYIDFIFEVNSLKYYWENSLLMLRRVGFCHGDV